MDGGDHAPGHQPTSEVLLRLASRTRDSRLCGEHEVVSTSTHSLLVPCQALYREVVQFYEQNEGRLTPGGIEM